MAVSTIPLENEHLARWCSVPVVGPIALSGWMCEVHQRRVRRHPTPVPKIDFGDFGEYIKRGLHVFLVQLVITMPLMFVFGHGFAAAIAVVAADQRWRPVSS
jgi:hypothetical protein